MTKDIYIFSGILQEIERQPGDETGIPPGASLYSEELWKKMIVDAGGCEENLIAMPEAVDDRKMYPD